MFELDSLLALFHLSFGQDFPRRMCEELFGNGTAEAFNVHLFHELVRCVGGRNIDL